MKKAGIGIGLILLVLLAGAGGAWASHKYWTRTVTITKTTPAKTHLATAPTCSSATLSATLDTSQGGGTAGSTYANLLLKNTGTKSCNVQGYPAVSLVDAAGTSIGSPAEHNDANGTGAALTLVPTGTAVAVVRFPDSSNFQPGTCQDGATALKVTPPNNSTVLNFPTVFTTWCPGFSVTALTQNSST